jgi:hypothetical protein
VIFRGEGRAGTLPPSFADALSDGALRSTSPFSLRPGPLPALPVSFADRSLAGALVALQEDDVGDLTGRGPGGDAAAITPVGRSDGALRSTPPSLGVENRGSGELERSSTNPLAWLLSLLTRLAQRFAVSWVGDVKVLGVEVISRGKARRGRCRRRSRWSLGRRSSPALVGDCGHGALGIGVLSNQAAWPVRCRCVYDLLSSGLRSVLGGRRRGSGKKRASTRARPAPRASRLAR